MIVIPAIDLRAGKCVRMEQGDPNKATVYDEDPVERARSFVRAGAKRLHVIDLDGAFGSGENHDAIKQICAAVDVPVQTGGGIRTLDQARARLDAGAAEIIIGSLFVDDERMARNIIGTLGAKVIAGVDARGRQVATHGWQERSPVDRDSLIKRVVQWGAERVIFTEIRRDGMGEGFDIDALRNVATAANVPVTASGGASSLHDLLDLKRAAVPLVDSCIVGSALYKGTLKLEDALSALN